MPRTKARAATAAIAWLLSSGGFASDFMPPLLGPGWEKILRRALREFSREGGITAAMLRAANDKAEGRS